MQPSVSIIEVMLPVISSNYAKGPIHRLNKAEHKMKIDGAYAAPVLVYKCQS